MKILAVDTSAKAASAAIVQEDKIIGEFMINTAVTHSQTLMPMIDALLKNSNTSVNDIDAIAVNAGPGSFTGVRIGVAAVKGIAFPKNLPCISVSTLESMAYNMIGNDCIVCSVMDARCSQVYNALFRVRGENVERLTNDRAFSLTDLKNELKSIRDKVFLVGDGAVLCNEFLDSQLDNVVLAPFNKRIQTASSVAYASLKKYKNGETMTADELLPIYLRLPQAQRELNRKMEVKQ